MEHTPPSSSSSSSTGGDGGGSPLTPLPSHPSAAAALAPSLTPASQPTISLLTDGGADALSVDSLTLLPPADPPRLHPCTGHLPLAFPRASIPEEEEEEEKEAESPIDETVQEEVDTLTVEGLGGKEEGEGLKEEEEDDDVPSEGGGAETFDDLPDSPELD